MVKFKLLMLKKIAPFLLIFFAVIILYYPVISTYFCQDDFFHFKVAQTDGTLKGLIYLIGFHPFSERKIAFYRPIFRDLLYHFFYRLFGLNPLPFRLLSICLHFFNAYLVYLFIQKLFKKKPLSYFVAFFYAIAASNVSTLYYLAGGIQVLGATTFVLTTLILFLKYLETNKTKFRNLFFLTFILALSSHEQTASLPLLLSGLIFIKYKFKKAKKRVLKLWPLFLILAIYLYLEITQIGYSSNELQYQAHLSLKRTVNSLMWYSGWAFGLPEMLIDFVRPGFKLDPRLMRYWGNYFKIIFPAFFIALAIFLFALVYLLLKDKKIIREKKLWFLIMWYLLAIAPVIFLPFHKSGHYLTPALPAFWAIIGVLFFRFFSKFRKNLPTAALILFSIFTGSLIILSSTSALLGKTNYWAAERGKLAYKLINDLTSKYPHIPEGSVVYFTNDPNYPDVSEDWGGTSKQAYFALNNQDAIQLYFNDPTLRVYYEDIEKIPTDISENKIFTLEAKIF